MNTINMLSRADMVKGQGVLSAHDEQVSLVKKHLSTYQVVENQWKVCDIMHYHTINPEFLLTLPLAKRKGICVGYVHFLPETVDNSLQLPKPIRKLFYGYLLHFYRRMDALVTVNPYFIEVLERYGIPRERVTYIPNYVSSEQFYPASMDQKREARLHFGLDPDKFTVVCAGQMQKRKGIFTFFDVAEQLPDIQFVWAGSFAFGKLSDGYEKIQERIKHLSSNVRLTGLVERSEMNAFYQMADVMFLPSFEELFPMTILEAMNCRIPILVRDLPIYQDILFDYCQKETDKDGFIRRIAELKGNQDLWEYAANKAYEGHGYYSSSRVALLWEAFYDKMIQTRKEHHKEQWEVL